MAVEEVEVSLGELIALELDGEDELDEVMQVVSDNLYAELDEAYAFTRVSTYDINEQGAKITALRDLEDRLVQAGIIEERELREERLGIY